MRLLEFIFSSPWKYFGFIGLLAFLRYVYRFNSVDLLTPIINLKTKIFPTTEKTTSNGQEKSS